MKLEWPMLTSTEPCDELRPMVTERFFMRYSNSRPSSRATAAAAAAAILASEGAGRPPLRPSARTGPAAAAAARHRQGRGRRSTEPDAVRRCLMDGGAGPMRGPHAHGAMAARPMASGAEASAAQHVRTSVGAREHGEGPENTEQTRAGERSGRPFSPEAEAAAPAEGLRRAPALCRGAGGPRERRGSPSPAGREGRQGKARQGRAGRRRACSLRPAGLACLPSSCLSTLPSPGLGRRRGPGALAPARGRAALARSSRPRRAGGQPPRWAPERGRRHRPQPTYVFFTRQIAHHACPHLAMLSETALMGGGGG